MHSGFYDFSRSVYYNQVGQFVVKNPHAKIPFCELIAQVNILKSRVPVNTAKNKRFNHRCFSNVSISYSERFKNKNIEIYLVGISLLGVGVICYSNW